MTPEQQALATLAPPAPDAFAGFSDADLLAECDKRGILPDIPDDDEERCDRDVQARDIQINDVERLAELIAGGETDEALEALSLMLPWHLPLPYLVKRRVADRRAAMSTRAA